MGTFVTLAEVVEARGSALGEDVVWSLLLGTVEALLDLRCKGAGSMCSMLSPGSVLLSSSGGLAFKSCVRSEDVLSFLAPEVQQGQATSSSSAAEKMLVYSLGMTLYWCVDYQLPPNQPVQCSEQLNSVLLSMCEDAVQRRADLLSVLETCELHHQACLLPPPQTLIKQLLDTIYREPVDHGTVVQNGAPLTDRSQIVRNKLHGSSFQNLSWSPKNKFSLPGSPCQSRTPQSLRHADSYGSSWASNHRHSNAPTLNSCGSTASITEKRPKETGPEFIRVLDEPLVVLELPGSIVSKKGKSASTQRELSVVMPNGRSILVKCDVKSRGGDVFDMIAAHANLVENFYFGLAYTDDTEFFFLDNDAKISKVAPDSWKKVPTTTFVLYFRIKFFVNDISFLLHKLTRHQFYLQLRKDLLEDRLSCHEETGLYLGGLALQAEHGDCMPEVYGRNYYRPDQYVAKSIMERRALPFLRDELLRLHNSNANMLADESELEFLKVIQQLPEFGVLFHPVAREKRPVFGELVLGVSAKGVMVYELKDGLRSTCQTFYWRETSSISASKHKFVIECRGSSKKHTFVTERSRTAKYLCDLCDAQHKFHNEMQSRQISYSLASEESYSEYAAMCPAQTQSSSCSGNPLAPTPLAPTPRAPTRPATPQNGPVSKLCDRIAARIEARFRKEKILHERRGGRQSPGPQSAACCLSEGPPSPSCSGFRDTPTNAALPEREVICVTLKRDPKLGLGIVIVGEDTTGRFDLGIFVATIVPGGPAEKDGRIRPGGRVISLNQASLEGMTFSEATEVMHNSTEEVHLIVSQPKVALTPNNVRSRPPNNCESQTPSADEPSSGEDLAEIVSVMISKTASSLHVPDVRILPYGQNSGSRSEEISMVLWKKAGSLGLSIAGGVNTSLRNGGIYVKSLVSGGAVECDGRIQTGDRLLMVDGITLSGFTYERAVECLANTGEMVTLVVEREGMSTPRVCLSPDDSSLSPHSPSPDRGNPPPSSAFLQPLTVNHVRNNSCPAIIPYNVAAWLRDYSFVSNDNTLEVTLRRGPTGLGFSFLLCELERSGGSGGSEGCGGCSGSVKLVRVKQLFRGQPAQQSGRVEEGDVILAVNGEPLKDLSYPRVLQLLRGTPEVRLALCRPAPGMLPSIGQFTGT